MPQSSSGPRIPAAAIGLTLRADLRRRWRPLLALALLLGLLGGVVLTAAAGARRTDTAYPRLLASASASQVEIVPQVTGLTGYFRALAKLPQIESMATGQLFQAALPDAKDTPGPGSSQASTGRGARGSTGPGSSPGARSTMPWPARRW